MFVSSPDRFTTKPDASDDPRDVLAISFNDPLLAREALLAATRLSRNGSVELSDAVLVNRTKGGRTVLNQTRDVSGGRGAIMGAWLGSLAGLFAAGSAGWLIGTVVGAALGFLWGRLRDIGIPDGFLHEVGRRIPVGQTALVVMLPRLFPTHLMSELRRFRGTLVYNTLDDIDSEDLEAALAFGG